GTTVALALPLAVQRVDVDDAYPEDRLHRALDLDLVGVGRDEERVHVLVERRVRLLRHDGTDDDVAWTLRGHSPSSASSPSPDAPPKWSTTVVSESLLNTSQSLTSTS